MAGNSRGSCAVERVCDRVLYLKGGAIKKEGPPRETIDAYNEEAHSSPGLSLNELNNGRSANLRSLVLCDTAGVPQSTFMTGDAFIARVELQNSEALEDVIVDIIFYTPGGNIMCELTTDVQENNLRVPAGSSVVEFACEELGLLAGLFYAGVRIMRRSEVEAIDVLAKAAAVRVGDGRHSVRGILYQPQQWRLQSSKSSQPEPVKLKSDSSKNNI